MLAMALDTVAAALASPVVGRVVVVTDDPVPGEAAALLGAEVIADVPDAGLNPALAYAATLVRPRGATASLPGVAALPADLPALRTEDLTEALRQAEEAARRPAAGAGARSWPTPPAPAPCCWPPRPGRCWSRASAPARPRPTRPAARSR